MDNGDTEPERLTQQFLNGIEARLANIGPEQFAALAANIFHQDAVSPRTVAAQALAGYIDNGNVDTRKSPAAQPDSHPGHVTTSTSGGGLKSGAAGPPDTTTTPRKRAADALRELRR